MNAFPARPLRIGPVVVDPPVLQAPMAGFTNWAYRAMVRRFGGVGLAATEMVSARGLIEMDRRDEGEPDRLWGVREEPRPLAVQIWDNDPDTLAEVARRIARDYRASVVDLNFGCPARDVCEKAESGAHLLQYPDQVGRIVERVVAACGDVPVTAKIRLGPSDDRVTAVDVAQAVEAAGGQALTVHGRTTRQRFGGAADWEAIARIKPHLRHIPLIGNGDLRTPQDAVLAFHQYGVDGLMIGRAAVARPWLFAQVAAAMRGEPVPPDPTPEKQRDLLLDHFGLVVRRFGERKGAVLMRTYASAHGSGLPGARRFRATVSRAVSAADMLEAIRRTFPSANATASEPRP
jgi:tRNA-dihydrouridine synthase B